MNENELRAKLIEAARKNPPDDRVPYAFEKRILSRLAGLPKVSSWHVWERPLWNAALSCVALTFLCVVWAWVSRPAGDSSDNFSQDFEAAVLAPPNSPGEASW